MPCVGSGVSVSGPQLLHAAERPGPAAAGGAGAAEDRGGGAAEPQLAGDRGRGAGALRQHAGPGGAAQAGVGGHLPLPLLRRGGGAGPDHAAAAHPQIGGQQSPLVADTSQLSH